MASEAEKERVLGELAARIDTDAEAGDRSSLHNLSAALFWRLQGEDISGRSVDTLFGALRAFLQFIRRWPKDVHWSTSSTRTGIAMVGRARIHPSQSCARASRFALPPCAELNRRRIWVFTRSAVRISSPGRTASGELLEVLPAEQAELWRAAAGVPVIFRDQQAIKP
ncbi:MAG: hypothetical protein R3E50_01480 [Halioglobus sp.]